MLYHQKTRSESLGKVDELRNQFEELYKEHKIDIIGFWENADDPTEVYYIAHYESEEDYKTKTSKLRSDERYSSLTEQLKETRVSTKAVRLTPKWIPS